MASSDVKLGSIQREEGDYFCAFSFLHVRDTSECHMPIVHGTVQDRTLAWRGLIPPWVGTDWAQPSVIGVVKLADSRITWMKGVWLCLCRVILINPSEKTCPPWVVSFPDWHSGLSKWRKGTEWKFAFIGLLWLPGHCDQLSESPVALNS